jgi:hypothetical protein
MLTKDPPTATTRAISATIFLKSRTPLSVSPAISAAISASIVPWRNCKCNGWCKSTCNAWCNG